MGEGARRGTLLELPVLEDVSRKEGKLLAMVARAPRFKFKAAWRSAFLSSSLALFMILRPQCTHAFARAAISGSMVGMSAFVGYSGQCCSWWDGFVRVGAKSSYKTLTVSCHGNKLYDKHWQQFVNLTKKFVLEMMSIDG